MTELLRGALEQGFLYALVTFGILISFRVIDFPDLTVDGSFTLGAAVLAVGVASGYNPLAFTSLAILAGATAGVVTATLHTKLGINKIVSGIVVMIILYSINLRVMGRSNISLLRHPSLIDYFSFVNISQEIIALLLFAFILFLIKVILDWFFTTKLGTLLRALGNNEQFVITLGFSTDRLKILGIALANSLVALAGALAAQNQGFADVNMGFGVVMIGFASLVIGETVIGSSRVPRMTFAAITGTCLYFIIISVAIRLGLNPGDLRLITGLVIITVLATSRLRKE